MSSVSLSWNNNQVEITATEKLDLQYLRKVFTRVDIKEIASLDSGLWLCAVDVRGGPKIQKQESWIAAWIIMKQLEDNGYEVFQFENQVIYLRKH